MYGCMHIGLKVKSNKFLGHLFLSFILAQGKSIDMSKNPSVAYSGRFLKFDIYGQWYPKRDILQLGTPKGHDRLNTISNLPFAKYLNNIC